METQKDAKQVVLISGISSGIGNAIGHLFEKKGYRVYGTSRYASSAPKIPGIEMLSLDVRVPHSVQSCVNEVLSRAGKIDVLINNAGYALMGAAEESSDEEIAAQLDTNFYGVIRLTRAVLPLMRKRRQGHIINISSLVGRISMPFMGIYSASKHAVEAYSEALYHELLPLGVSVSLIEPGFIHTAFGDHSTTTKIRISDYAPWYRQTLDSVQQHLAQAPLPDLVAVAVLRAAESEKPKLRYLVGSDANLVARLRKWIPETMFGRILRREFGLNRVPPLGTSI
jgi:short-subunit dehydrogenase